jgi:hypothetical protein
MRVWYVTESHASVDGEDLGPIGALHEQAHIAHFYIAHRPYCHGKPPEAGPCGR